MGVAGNSKKFRFAEVQGQCRLQGYLGYSAGKVHCEDQGFKCVYFWARKDECFLQGWSFYTDGSGSDNIAVTQIHGHIVE